MDLRVCHWVSVSQHFEAMQCLHLQKPRRILSRHHITLKNMLSLHTLITRTLQNKAQDILAKIKHQYMYVN